MAWHTLGRGRRTLGWRGAAGASGKIASRIPLRIARGNAAAPPRYYSGRCEKVYQRPWSFDTMKGEATAIPTSKIVPGSKNSGPTGGAENITSWQHEPITRPAVERIAAFTAAARPEHLTSNIRQLFKRNILDSLGCAIGALRGPPCRALREQFEEYRAPCRCTLIGGGKTALDRAALFNSGLTRYVDLLDSYMSAGGLAHPSDNFGTVLAAAEYVDASGDDFMLALAVAYEIQCRFTTVVIAVITRRSSTGAGIACGLRSITFAASRMA